MRVELSLLLQQCTLDTLELKSGAGTDSVGQCRCRSYGAYLISDAFYREAPRRPKARSVRLTRARASPHLARVCGYHSPSTDIKKEWVSLGV